MALWTLRKVLTSSLLVHEVVVAGSRPLTISTLRSTLLYSAHTVLYIMVYVHVLATV